MAHEVRVSSPGITIDLTPPVVTAVEIDTGGAYHTGKGSIKVKWHGVFEDPQSGMDLKCFSKVIDYTFKIDKIGFIFCVS